MTAVPPPPQEDEERPLPPDRAEPPLPQQTPTYRGRELAGHGRRVAAELVDALVLLVLALALGLLFGFPYGVWLDQLERGMGQSRENLAFSGLIVLAAAIYHPLVMTPTNGLTLGKYLTGLRVIREDLSPMTYVVASVRGALLKGIAFAFALPVYVISVLWPLWDGERRALHDMIARTRVIRERAAAPGDRRY